MAKLKFSPRSRDNRAAFERTGDLFAMTDGEPPRPQVALTPTLTGHVMADFEVHPSISGYVHRMRQKSCDRSSLEIDPHALHTSGRLTFISFGSGSSGNCAYLGSADGGILIDAGVNADNVREAMRTHGINPRSIRGIVLTHDHTDHVKYVYALVKKRPDLPIYCTPKTLSGLLRRHSISRRIKDFHRPIYKEFAFTAGPFTITPFDVSHDGTDNVGYFIEYGDIKVTVATDLGCIGPRVDYYMQQANHIVIESNYDERMLINGPYPMHLKARIAADNGHLDNSITAAYLARIASPKLRNVFLCHLSQDNNMPEVALETVTEALRQAGITTMPHGSGSLDAPAGTIQLSALPRLIPSAMFTLT